MLRASKVVLLLSLLLSFSFVSKIYALEVPSKPTVPVVDQARVLNSNQVQALSNKIEAEATSSSNQIGVLIIPSLQGETLADYSIKVARSWGIGTKDKNNGVLLLVAINDRRLRIEVGYGLEGALTDARSNQIIENDITPSFKAGNYYQGIDNGVSGIIASIHNEYTGSAAISSKDSSNIPIGFGALLLPIFLLVWLSSILARSKSWWGGGVVGGLLGVVVSTAAGTMLVGLALIFILIFVGLFLDKVVSGNYRQKKANKSIPSWWAGGGFGGGRSGGGFGGGSFGGGGSSGSW